MRWMHPRTIARRTSAGTVAEVSVAVLLLSCHHRRADTIAELALLPSCRAEELTLLSVAELHVTETETSPTGTITEA